MCLIVDVENLGVEITKNKAPPSYIKLKMT
jgi:hypothetical protein